MTATQQISHEAIQKVCLFRSSLFLVKGVLKICSKFTGEHPWMAVLLRTPLDGCFCHLHKDIFHSIPFYLCHTLSILLYRIPVSFTKSN